MCYSMQKREIAIFERRQRILHCPNSMRREIILDKYQATEKRLEEIQQILQKPHCPIQKLEIRQNQMNDKKIQYLCEAIKLNTSLTKICFMKCRIRSSQLALLSDAICKQKSQCIQELQFFQVRINVRGAESISKILTANVGLNRLHLVDCGIDDDVLTEICKGLQDSMSIQYLDLRNNSFDSIGLSCLIKALGENMSLKQLFLESVKIDKQEAFLLSEFFGQKDCQIQELQLSEAELDKNSIDTILESFFNSNHLKGLSLSKNSFNEQICKSLSVMPKRLQKFESLTLSHCELGISALNSLLEGFSNQCQIKYLDLSWNNINSQAIEIICEMLVNNKQIEKLQLQHNYIESSGTKVLVEAIQYHKKIWYLDISANEINSKGFLYFNELFSMNHQLKYLFARKNEIEGSEVAQFPQKLYQNSNLVVLDLQGNSIENDCSIQILELLNRNYFIEEILITGNQQINQNTKESINQECNQNVLIKQYIIPQLQIIQNQEEKSEELIQFQKQSVFKNLNVEILRLEDKNFQRSDFIAKFINMNKNQFHQLSLNRVYFDENLKDIALFFINNNLKLTRLEINDCSVSESSLKTMIESFKNMTTLKELRLINLKINQIHTRELAKSVSDHKNLKILDLSQNQIQCMEDISALISKNQYIQELNLEGNPIGKIEDFRYLLVGMANNISVVKFSFELKRVLLDEQMHEYDKIDQKEIKLLEQQVEMNRYINKEVIPIHVQKRIKNTNTVDMSYHDIYEDNIEAVVKFFKIQLQGQVKKTKLILVSCNIDDSTILALVGALLKIGNFELDLLDLSYNNLSDQGCAHLTNLFSAGKRIKSLSLGKNYIITLTGFKTIMKSIRKNSIISSLDFSQCSIEITGNQGGIETILEDIQSNCSLINLDLSGNNIKEDYIELLNNELQQNKSIQDIIIPSILKRGQQQQKQIVHPKMSLFDKVKAGGTLNFGKKKDYKGQAGKDHEDRSNSVPKTKESIGIERVDSKSSFQDGQGSSKSSYKVEYGDLDQNAQIQKLSLRGKNLKSLDFLSKFMRLNPNILDIDIGENPLSDKEMQKFTKNVQNNPNIRKIDLDGIKNLKSGTRTIINNEITKNDMIQEFIKNNMNSTNGDKSQLNLQHKSIQNIGFLYKFLQGYQDLKVLDLRDNQLGKRGAIEITKLIKETKTIEVLNLQSNRIGPTGLQHICSALIENQSIKVLDIRDNIVEDESLKILYVMLFKNDVIEQIQYSLANEENIRRRDLFKSICHLEIKEIEQKLKEEDHGHHDISAAQKICFPIWCWKSFIHDKHEAFRFKYDTKSLRKIEDEVMDEITLILQINSVIYYIIMFVCPVIFVEECGMGLSDTSHFIYVFYSLLTIIMEVFLVLKIQKRIQNKNILQFNKWHVVEIIMGQIARFDTYLDVCFFSLLYQCSQWELVIPVGVFIILYLIYPLYTLVRISAMGHSLQHTMPKIEKNCMVSFIREQMLLATVLDSFCIDNSIEVFKKPVHFGRFMGVYTLLFQDGPQMLIHLIFLFFLDSHISHSETTVVLSLIVSTFAIHISVFNIVMCTQNEFDPILLQLELKKRKDKLDQKESKIKISQDMINKKLSVQKQQSSSHQKENRFSKQESQGDFQEDQKKEKRTLTFNQRDYQMQQQNKVIKKVKGEITGDEDSSQKRNYPSDADFGEQNNNMNTESMSPALKSKEMRELQNQKEKQQQNSKNNQTPKFQINDAADGSKKGIYLEISKLQKQKSYDQETGFPPHGHKSGNSYDQGHSSRENNPQSMDFTRQPFDNSHTDR